MPYGVDYSEKELRLGKAIAQELLKRGIFSSSQPTIAMTYGVEYSDTERRVALAVADAFSTAKIGTTGTWTKVSPIGGGWSNVAGCFELAYCQEGNNLRILGTIAGGTAGVTTLFTLPVGMRPPSSQPSPIEAFDGTNPVAGYVFVASDGSVIINTLGTTITGVNVSLPLSQNFP